MPTFADAVCNNARFNFAFVTNACQPVSAEHFARLPRVNNEPLATNHPAFALGHITIYPVRLLRDVLRIDYAAAAPPEGYDALFEQGQPCKDDPGGSVYPTKDEILAAYTKAYTACIDAVETLPDDTFAAPNPVEQIRDRFPTVGAATNFLLTSHVAIHAGQISAWRRLMGYGPVM